VQQQTPLTEVLLQLQKLSRKRLVWETEIKEKITARLVNVTLEQALDFLLSPRGYGWQPLHQSRGSVNVQEGYRIFRRESGKESALATGELPSGCWVSPILHSNEWRCSLRPEPGWDRVGFDAARWEIPTVIVEDGERPEMWFSYPGTEPRAAVCFRNTFVVSLPQNRTALRTLPIEIGANGRFTVRVNGAVLAHGDRNKRCFDLGEAVVDGLNVLAVAVETVSPGVSALLQVRWAEETKNVKSDNKTLPEPPSHAGIIWKRLCLKRLDPFRLARFINESRQGAPGRLADLLRPLADVKTSVLPEATLAIGGDGTSVEALAHLLRGLDENEQWCIGELPFTNEQPVRELMEGVRRTASAHPILVRELLSVFHDEPSGRLVVLGSADAIRILQEMMSQPLPKRRV